MIAFYIFGEMQNTGITVDKCSISNLLFYIKLFVLMFVIVQRPNYPFPFFNEFGMIIKYLKRYFIRM